jgi:tetratricopeptide (TPR) repeat protein
MVKLLSNKLVAVVLAAIFAVALSNEVRAQQQNIDEKEQIEAQSAYIDGLAAFENENYQQAIELLNKAYVKLPDHAGINFALADVYLAVNDLENAEYYGKQATKLEPQNRWYHAKLIDIYRKAGQIDAAVKELNTTLEYYPRDDKLLFQLAQIYDERGKLREANRLYNQLLRLSGDAISIRLKKLNNFNRRNMRDSAIVELQKIRNLDPDNLSTLQALSRYYIQMDRIDEAQEVLQDALQIDNKDPETLIMLADVYISQSKWESVGTNLGDVIADSTVSSKTKAKVARYIYSQFQEDKQNTNIRDAMSAIFQQVLNSRPQPSETLTLAADFFSETQQNELALKALERTTAQVPTNDTAWQQRLQLLMMQGQTNEAIAVGQQAAENIPQDPIILYFLGSAYLSNQQLNNAIDKLEAASTLPARRPLKASIYGSLGNAYAGIDKWDQAFNNYDQSLKLNPKNAGVLNNYAYYLSVQKKDLTKAEKMAQQAIEIEPKNASYLDTLGWIYYQKKEYQQAKKYIRASIDTGQASAEVLEHMGDVMDKLGNKEQAKEWWQKAFKKDSSRSHLKEKISR